MTFVTKWVGSTDRGAIGQDWNFVAADYIRSLEWAGALPVVIPQFDDAANAVGF